MNSVARINILYTVAYTTTGDNMQSYLFFAGVRSQQYLQIVFLITALILTELKSELSIISTEQAIDLMLPTAATTR